MRPELLNPVLSHAIDRGKLKFLCCALLMIFASAIAQQSKATSQSPTLFVETIFAELTHEFRAFSSTPSTAQVEALFKEKLSPHIDFPGLARWILREHWGNSAEIQRDAFMVALQKHVIKTYAAALSFDEGLAITLDQEVKSGKRLIQITGTLTSPESSSTDILFRLVEGTNAWRIFDVGVQGISIAKTLRADVTAIAGEGGIDAVTDALTAGNFQLVSQR